MSRLTRRTRRRTFGRHHPCAGAHRDGSQLAERGARHQDVLAADFRRAPLRPFINPRVNTMRTHPFTAHGRDYEIRVWREGEWTVVQCFLGNEPIGVRFGVADQMAADMRFVAGESAVRHLIEIAQGDVENA